MCGIGGRSQSSALEDEVARIRTAHVGIDVSQETLAICWRGLKGATQEVELENGPTGYDELVKRIAGGRIQRSRVVFEATGPYHAPLRKYLQAHPKVEVMVVSPLAAVSFAKARMTRAKTDAVDARTLLAYCETMEFRATASVSEEAEAVRALGRMLLSLIEQRTAVKNHRHASTAYGLTVLEEHQKQRLGALDQQIKAVQKDLLARINAVPKWQRTLERLVTQPGFAERSVGSLLSEFVTIPADLTAKQIVAWAGVDPRPRLSGTSRTGKSFPISRRGNPRLRRTLYMMALVASQKHPAMAAYYDRMLARGKPKKVALVALMRKILVSTWMMFTRDQDFDPSSFTRTP